jgi:hypothetical protein
MVQEIISVRISFDTDTIIETTPSSKATKGKNREKNSGYSIENQTNKRGGTPNTFESGSEGVAQLRPSNNRPAWPHEKA